MTTIRPENTGIVLSHGAFHWVKHYQSLIDDLHAEGFEVRAPQLPTVGGAQPEFDEDVAVIRTEIEALISSGKNVAVLMHSYGGVCGSEAVKGLAKEKGSSKPGVVRLIYLAAFALPEDKSLMDVLPEQRPRPWFDEIVDGKAYRCHEAKEILYNDIDDETANRLAADLQDHAIGAFHSKLTYPAYQYVDSTYLVCEQDLALPAVMQEGMASQEGFSSVVRLDAGHTAWVSMRAVTHNAVTDAILGK